PTYHRRAVEIAAAIHDIPGVAIKPDPPQTHMMHIYLRGAPDRLMEASLALACDERVAIIPWLRPADVPGYAMFELSIGDGASAFTNEEIAGYFTRIVGEANAENAENAE
ncbi:MAG TPA: hypothetical protein VKQ36_01040, partial [Ktedonobacterales bacterium]|nr:hypothetical protein [Ktedonobacterales bacterium]